MAKSFYPNLATIVSIDAFPEQLQFIENGLENALQKIYFRDLQFVRSADGSHGLFNTGQSEDDVRKYLNA